MVLGVLSILAIILPRKKKMAVLLKLCCTNWGLFALCHDLQSIIVELLGHTLILDDQAV